MISILIDTLYKVCKFIQIEYRCLAQWRLSRNRYTLGFKLREDNQYKQLSLLPHTPHNIILSMIFTFTILTLHRSGLILKIFTHFANFFPVGREFGTQSNK